MRSQIQYEFQFNYSQKTKTLQRSPSFDAYLNRPCKNLEANKKLWREAAKAE